LLSARGISKRFGGVRALSSVAFDVRAGEATACRCRLPARPAFRSPASHQRRPARAWIAPIKKATATALPTRGSGLIDRRRRRLIVQRVLDSLGVAVDLSKRVAELPLPQRQLVEIGRALCGGGSIFVLDEPTSSLSAPEAAG
jgi:ABC-type sugar transport system ATPase subunit